MKDITVDELVSEIRARTAHADRFLVGIAGPPGAGKSTLAEAVAEALGHDAAVVPMDGFHLDNAELDALGLRARKGAPETFDAAGFAGLLTRLRTEAIVSYPTFDRAADRTVPDGAHVGRDVRIAVVEGNYLLLDDPDWLPVAQQLDLTVMIDVPISVLEARLVQRWLDHGLSLNDARLRAQGNDLRNAARVLDVSAPADFRIVQDS